MKLVGIGDYLIPNDYMAKGFAPFRELGYEVETVYWDVPAEEMSEKIMAIERYGAEACTPPDYIRQVCRDADVIITQFCPVTEAMMEENPNLKMIGITRGGAENVNIPAATARGIRVFNTPGRNSNAVADFTVGMLLAECRNIARSHAELKARGWVREYDNRDYVPDLAGKTAGIIGYGNIGKKVARRLRAFDMNIIAYDPFCGPDTDVELTALPELMKRSDFVLVHYRLLPETRHLINREMLSLMKPTAYFINTARAGLVDEEALYELLREHKIYGAALDVFATEPIGPEYPLASLSNVTVTPHLAGSTRDAFLNSPVLLEAEMRKVVLGGTSSFQMN